MNTNSIINSIQTSNIDVEVFGLIVAVNFSNAFLLDIFSFLLNCAFAFLKLFKFVSVTLRLNMFHILFLSDFNFSSYLFHQGTRNVLSRLRYCGIEVLALLWIILVILAASLLTSFDSGLSKLNLITLSV